MSPPQLLLAKKETVYGTDAVPVAANAIWAENVKYTPKGDYKTGDVAKPGIGPIAGQPYGQYGELSFDVPLQGSGTVGTIKPNWDLLIQACGWSSTVVVGVSATYALLANPRLGDALSIYWREERRKHVLLGSRGKVGLKMDAGERPMLNFLFRGLFVPAADAAIPVHADAVWTGWKDARVVSQANTTFTYAGIASKLRSLSIEQSDNVKFVDIPGQNVVDLRGDRAFSGKLKMSTPLLTDVNLEALFNSGAVSTWQAAHGTVATQIVTVNGRSQNGQPTYGNEDGFDTSEVDLMLKPSGLAVDDEISIAIT